ncbi:MAG TPA: porin [Burkholderiaceae bacterium]|nr:porin [Burkholderiaceae bacterium]
MKKSLLALAVIGAFAATASAQTNVTLYGIADAGIGMADRDGASDSHVNVFSGVQSTSRFGVRGSEDLGSGLRATFNIEAGVNWDTGDADSSFWQRRAVVGLAGGFGEVRLGRDYTPGFTAAGTTDVMGYGLFGNWLTYTAGGLAHGGLNGITTRASNGLHYTSPNWGGLTIRAMYATTEGDDTVGNAKGDIYGVSGVYANGPLTVSAYYQYLEAAVAGTTDNNEVNQYGIGAQYRFGAFRVAANYGMADTDFAAGGGSQEHEGFGIGAGMKIGTGELLVNYIHQEVDSAGDPEADTWGIAYVHPLSKRTNLYASYGQTGNDNGGQFGLRYSQAQVSPNGTNADVKAFAVGIRHLF